MAALHGGSLAVPGLGEVWQGARGPRASRSEPELGLAARESSTESCPRVHGDGGVSARWSQGKSNEPEPLAAASSTVAAMPRRGGPAAHQKREKEVEHRFLWRARARRCSGLRRRRQKRLIRPLPSTATAVSEPMVKKKARRSGGRGQSEKEAVVEMLDAGEAAARLR